MMGKALINLGLILVLPAYGQNNSFSEHVRLFETLEKNLYGNIRPLHNQSKSVIVTVDAYILAIEGLNEKEQLLDSTIAMRCRWKYETLVWNSSEYGGVRKMNLSPKNVWIPDLTISNSVDSLFVLTEHNDIMYRITVESNGDAVWETRGNIRTTCHIDITKYPFDIQTCYIIIGKFETDSEVYLTQTNGKVSTVNYKENGKWNLKSAVVEETLLFGNFTNLYIKLKLARYSFFYVFNVIIPVALLSFMMVLSFKIPPTSGERLGYNVALLLAFVMLLNLIGESMPKVSKRISYLQMYVNYQLVTGIAISALSILPINLAHTQNEANVPSIFKCYWCYFRFYQRNKSIKRNDAEKGEMTDKIEEPQDEREKVKSPSDGNAGLLKDKEVMVQHIGDALSWVFMIMYILSTIMFFVSVLV